MQIFMVTKQCEFAVKPGFYQRHIQESHTNSSSKKYVHEIFGEKKGKLSICSSRLIAPVS